MCLRIMVHVPSYLDPEPWVAPKRTPSGWDSPDMLPSSPQTRFASQDSLHCLRHVKVPQQESRYNKDSPSGAFSGTGADICVRSLQSHSESQFS